MTDTRLRDLERRYRQTGNRSDYEAYALECGRASIFPQPMSGKFTPVLVGPSAEASDFREFVRSLKRAELSYVHPHRVLRKKLVPRPLTVRETMEDIVNAFNDGSGESLISCLNAPNWVVPERPNICPSPYLLTSDAIFLQGETFKFLPAERYFTKKKIRFANVDGPEFDTRELVYDFVEGQNRAFLELACPDAGLRSEYCAVYAELSGRIWNRRAEPFFALFRPTLRGIRHVPLSLPSPSMRSGETVYVFPRLLVRREKKE